MGFDKERRPVISTPAQLLGTTEGTIDSWPPVTIITSTNNVNFTLPTPQAGLQKTVVLDFTGATGDVQILCKSTATTFNGSTANALVCSSSQEHIVYNLVGITTARWSVGWSATPTTAAWPVSFAGSTAVA